MRKELGFINKYLYTDVNSYKIFRENGKTFAVEVKKEQAVKPEFIPGGFSAICLNNEEVFRGGKVVEIGKPFEITFSKRAKAWGYEATSVSSSIPCTEEEYAKYIDKWMECAKEYNQRIEFDREGHHVYFIDLTPTGRDRRHFVKLGSEIDQECLYYYDYNF